MNTDAYVVIMEPAEDGSFSVYVPDLPGCVSSGDTIEEAEAMIREAIALHIASLKEHGEPVPPPVTRSLTVSTVAA